MPWTCRLLSHAVGHPTLLPTPRPRLRGPHRCLGPLNRSLMLLTFAADAVDLPDRLRSRSFTDTVDLPTLTDAVDLLIHPLDLAIARRRR